MKKIFVNCSNHASGSWSAAQKAAAEAYGEIVDVKFPAVPSDPLAYLKPIVDETFNKIMAYHPVAMMLAGEPLPNGGGTSPRNGLGLRLDNQSKLPKKEG